MFLALFALNHVLHVLGVVRGAGVVACRQEVLDADGDDRFAELGGLWWSGMVTGECALTDMVPGVLVDWDNLICRRLLADWHGLIRWRVLTD